MDKVTAGPAPTGPAEANALV